MKDTNKLVRWIAAFVAIVVVLGCGGGGGGTGGSGSTSGGLGGGAKPAAGQYLEFFRSGSLVDPLNLNVGDIVTVQYVNYDQLGVRTALAVTNWGLTGSGAGSAVTLTNTGVMQVISRPTGFLNLTATATVIGQPKTLNQDVFVSPATNTRVSGRLLANTSNVAVGGVQFEFVDNGGNVVGAAITGYDGRFTGVVGNNATRLRLKPQTVSAFYFAAIKYQNVDYAVTGNACLLTLPGLVAGGSVSFPSNIFLPRQQDGPPPPPSGCN